MNFAVQKTKSASPKSRAEILNAKKNGQISSSLEHNRVSLHKSTMKY
jgi:hypothetical protein